MADQVATVVVTAVGIHMGAFPPLSQTDGIVPDVPRRRQAKNALRAAADGCIAADGSARHGLRARTGPDIAAAPSNRISAAHAVRKLTVPVLPFRSDVRS